VKARAGGYGADSAAYSSGRRHRAWRPADVRCPADRIGAGGIRAVVERDEYTDANSASGEEDEKQANDPYPAAGPRGFALGFF
jgi:hypothetical protein